MQEDIIQNPVARLVNMSMVNSCQFCHTRNRAACRRLCFFFSPNTNNRWPKIIGERCLGLIKEAEGSHSRWNKRQDMTVFVVDNEPLQL